MIDRFFTNISNFNRESLTEIQNIQVSKNIILLMIIWVMFVLKIYYVCTGMCLHVGLACEYRCVRIEARGSRSP